MAFNFGSTANKSLFGSTTTTSAPTFGGLGSTTTSTSSGFSFGGFGAKTTTAASTGFGFGTGTTTTTSGGFGAGTSGGGLFGGAGTAASGTGMFGGTSTGTGFGFGAAKTTGSTFGFGSTQGITSTAGFGAGLGLGLATQQGQQQQQQQDAAQQLNQTAVAVSLPLIFGDERDALLAKWNQLQAFWGVGKGYFAQSTPPVNFTADNPFCRFKAIGYSYLPRTRNEDGLVGLMLKKKEAEVKASQEQVVATIHKILGGSASVSVCVEGLKQLPDDTTELTIYIQERSAAGAVKKYKATEVANHMNQATIKSQLSSQLLVINIVAKTGLTREQLKNYLETPPAGIDPLLWQQAKLDNPDPDKLIPVPMIGFSELHKRLQHQQQQTKMHQTRLDMIAGDISDLQRNQTNTMAKLEQYRRKHLELGHRVLQILVRQEVYRKLGFAVQAEEEQLRVQLETIQSELNAPTQFKGRLNELMSQMRLQSQFGASRGELGYQLDTTVQQDIKQHLKAQQQGLQHLISIIKEDVEDLNLIEQGLADTTHRR